MMRKLFILEMNVSLLVDCFPVACYVLVYYFDSIRIGYDGSC